MDGVGGIAMVIGPLGGGLLVDHASWRWIFAINVPFVLATLALVRAAVPESVDEESTHRIDYLGALLVALGLAGPVFALIEQPTYGFGDPIVALPGLAGVALLVAFVLHERRSDHPMLPLAIFRSRNFAVGNVATLLVYGGLGAATFFVAIYLQQVAGYTAVAAGVTLMPITVIMFLLSRRFGALSDRIGPRALMGFGPIVGGCGLIAMGRIGTHVDYLGDLLPGRAAVRPRAVGDRRAADQHGARRGAAAQRGRRERRQQRDLAHRRPARDRGGRRGRGRAVRLRARPPAGRPRAQRDGGRGGALGQGPPAVGRRAARAWSSTERSRPRPCTRFAGGSAWAAG